MTTSKKCLYRFHLMIGAACSGKSTAARLLIPLLEAQEQRPVRYVSSALARRELYGDPSIYGRWAEVEGEIRRQMLQAIAADESVVVEASYTRRCFRLAMTQALELPVTVQWIGWWLDTPLQQCLQWNQQREVALPTPVIRRHCAQLLQAAPIPHRQEGFAYVARLRPDQGVPLEQLISTELDRLNDRLRRSGNRDAAYQLHGYSRLLDVERLLYLIRLLSEHPKVSATRIEAAQELEQLLSPLPAGGLAERAAALLARLHGACYGDVQAVSQDLYWLDEHGFTQRWLGVADEALPAIEPPPWPLRMPRPQGGLPRLADRQTFQQVFTLLRHLLRKPRDLGCGERISKHLARSLNALATSRSTEGGTGGTGGAGDALQPWSARKVQVAINDTLTPYGFRLPGRSGRRGYSLGTALLSLPELREVNGLLQLQAEHLGDSQAAALSAVLRERLAAIDEHPPSDARARQGADGGEVEQRSPRRRWIPAIPPLPPVTPAASAGGGRARLTSRGSGAGSGAQLAIIETAISQRQRLLLSELRPVGDGSEHAAQPQAVWPLQLLLHRGHWWLLVEHDAIGQPYGLLRCIQLRHLHVYQSECRPGRELGRHERILERARVLERCCGGLCFGDQLAGQQALIEQVLCQQPGREGERRRAAAPWLVRLRLSCSAAVLAALRRELDRFPQAAVRLAAALPGDSWGRPEPGSSGMRAGREGRLTYPLELDVPSWVVAGDGDLRHWLYSYGAELRIEAPAALAVEHQQWLRTALAVYPDASPSTSPLAGEAVEAAAPAAEQLQQQPPRPARRKRLKARATAGPGEDVVAENPAELSSRAATAGVSTGSRPSSR
jgi:predicted kinase